MRRITILLIGVILTTAVGVTGLSQDDDGGTFDARGIPPTPLPEAPVD